MSKFFGWLKKDKPKSEPQNPTKSTPEEAQEAEPQIDDNIDSDPVACARAIGSDQPETTYLLSPASRLFCLYF